MSGWLFVYLLGLASCFFIGVLGRVVIYGIFKEKSDKITGARLMLFCWAWPVVVIVLGWLVVKQLVKDAVDDAD